MEPLHMVHCSKVSVARCGSVKEVPEPEVAVGASLA